MPLSFARRTAATLTVVAVTAVGCGAASELSARQELSGAMGALDDRSTLSVSLSLDTTAERLVEVAAADGEVLSLDDAELIAGSSVVVTVASPDGTPLEDLAPEVTPEVALAVLTPDGELVDVRYVDEDLYARADVARLGELADQPVPTAEELGTQEIPGLEFVPALLGGQWITIDGQELEAIGRTFAPSTAPEVEADPSRIEALRGKLADAFDRSVTVTQDGADAELGERYLLEASPRRLLDELPGLLGALELPEAGLEEYLSELTDLSSAAPDEPATVALYLRDDAVTAIRLDLGQFADDGSADGVALLLRFDRSDEGIDAPTDATAVDVAAIFRMLMSTGIDGEPSA